MIIHSSNKTTDPELVGHEGMVTKIENNGWVELNIPKLGAQYPPGCYHIYALLIKSDIFANM